MLALFGVKLRRKDVVAMQCGGKLYPVGGGRRDIALLKRFYIIAVHKIEAFILLYALPKWVITHLVHLIPAHVGNLERVTIVILQSITKKAHLAGQDVKTGGTAILFALAHQCLHAHTDA